MQRTNLILSLLLCLIVAPQLASAGSNASGFGLGIIVGEPTGLDAKLWLSERSALQGAVAWSLESHSSLHIHTDYILHNFNLIDISKGRMPLYFGIGGRIRLGDDGYDDNVGVRIPVGLDYMFEGEPIDIFLEVVPILDLVPDTDFDLNAAIGARFFF